MIGYVPTALVIVAVLAYFLFDETLDRYTALGSGIILQIGQSLDREVDALGSAAREDDFPGLAADEGGHLGAGATAG